MLLEKSACLRIAVQSSEAGDFLNILLRFLGFWGSFSYKNCSYKKKHVIMNSSFDNVFQFLSSLLVFLTGWLGKMEGMIKNWWKWSNLVQVRITKITSFDMMFENMVSIKVLEW